MLELTPIGTIHSPFVDPVGVPIQPRYAEGIAGHVRVDETYREALADLDGFEHIWLLYVFHRARGFSPRVIPFRDVVERGLFATRAPRRPNPIGLSVVKLEGIRGNRIDITGVDVVDGTPLIDIKPYVPEFDARPESRAGWFEEARAERQRADARFSADDG